MKNLQKGFAHLLIIFLIIFGGIGALGYFAYKNGQIKLPVKTTNTEKTSDNPVLPKETYKHSLGFYTFEYPGDWEIKDVSSSKHPYAILVRDYNIPTEVLIRVDDKTKSDCFSTDIKCFRKEEMEKITINGSEGYQVDTFPPFEGGANKTQTVRIVIFEKGNKMILLSQQRITSNEEALKTFDSILSTFKFTKTQIAANNKWSLFENKICDFTFNYPNNWEITLMGPNDVILRSENYEASDIVILKGAEIRFLRSFDTYSGDINSLMEKKGVESDSDYYVFDSRLVNVGTYKAVKIQAQSPGFIGISYKIPQGKHIYEAALNSPNYKEFENIFNQILSTFKFTD